MNAHQRLELAIEAERARLRATVPRDIDGAVAALVRRLASLPHVTSMGQQPDVLTGRQLIDAGGNLALALVLESHGGELFRTTDAGDIERWSECFLAACDDLAISALVLMQCEAGALRLVHDGGDDYAAWPATSRPLASILERSDWDWWASFSERRHRDAALSDATHSSTFERDEGITQAARDHVARMAFQLCYPDSAELCGRAIQRCRDVLEALIRRVLRSRARGELARFESRRALVAEISSELGDDPGRVDRVISAFSIDADGAGYHSAVPGVAAPPVVRFGDDRVILSPHGLLSHPLLFLTRELRRLDAQSYHNAAHFREDAFRQDLATVFADRRFVVSENQIRLRRKGGTLRTDIDFAVFDRKSGALGLFELKAQDPFPRSSEELARQRDNVLDANRQVAATLDWVNRHGADEILNRFDRNTAKRFRVRKVFAFVLGRYLVHFHDGPEPSRRAAWGTWPEVLRIVDQDDRFAAGQSPIATLHARLSGDRSGEGVVGDAPTRLIEVGAVRIAMYPSYAVFKRELGERD